MIISFIPSYLSVLFYFILFYLFLIHFISFSSWKSINLFLLTDLIHALPFLSALSTEIDELNEQCKGANAELHVLQSEASLMFKRLAAASKLIDGKGVDSVGDTSSS